MSVTRVAICSSCNQLPRTEISPAAWNILNRRLGQRQDDIQIVDHDVHHDANIGRAKRIAASPCGIDIFWIAHVGSHCRQRGIESLDMANLQRHILLTGERDQIVRLLRSDCDRLLNQKRQPAAEQFHRDGVMVRGRRYNDSRILMSPTPSSLKIGDRLCVRFLSHTVAARFHRIGHRDEFDIFQPRRNPRMDPAQMPRPDNSNT